LIIVARWVVSETAATVSLGTGLISHKPWQAVHSESQKYVGDCSAHPG
jgi:hypothetical protein